MIPRRLLAFVVPLWLLGGVAAPAAAQAVDRLVVIKADGLAQDILETFIAQRDPRTGKSLLPWIDHVFYQGGAHLSNFYVRGTSLSGPSWSLLDTGQSLQIKGNVEFDRYTLHSYDYLNFIPFWLANAKERRGDMWGTAVLDELRLPLLLDAYGYYERYQSFQLYQRGSGWLTLASGVQRRFTTRTTKQLYDEWQIGLDMRGMVPEQFEREIIEGLNDPRLKYLDYYTTDFDHAAHHNRDRATHLAALQELDAVVGRLWTAISRSAEASTTALVMVADHGVNSDERVYSQGFNLVHLLTSVAGGSHHVITKRRLLKDYSIKGVYPLVPLITSASPTSSYLKGKQDTYPTGLLDFDGNERASIHLRDSTLNQLHIMLEQLQSRSLAAPVRRALIDRTLALIEGRRAAWTQLSRDLSEELAALRATTAQLRAGVMLKEKELAKEKEKEQQAKKKDKEKADRVIEPPDVREQRLREIGQVETWTAEDADYGAYLGALQRLMSLTREALQQPLKVQEYIPPGAMGDRNSLYDLQHYVAGPAPGGMVLRPDGSLDEARSFTYVDYPSLITGVRIRNNVQPGVANQPVDMIALRVPCSGLTAADGDTRADTCTWLNGGAGLQALLLSRVDERGRVSLRYLPVADLTQSNDGTMRVVRRAWGAGLPLRIWEDERVATPAGSTREAWLSEWHSDGDWLRALHRSRYSNGLIGLHEQMAPHTWFALDSDEPGLDPSERLRRRYRARQRTLVEPDLLIMASDHWNFDVRGFNPGGNHGSFLRPSTHAVFMIAGGDATGLPRGKTITEPYDTLSFVPTMLALTGRLDEDNEPVAALRQLGFRRFPGRVVRELWPSDLPDSRTTSAAP